MSLVEANQAVLFVFDKNSTHTATIRGELEATATQGVFEAVEVQGTIPRIFFGSPFPSSPRFRLWTSKHSRCFSNVSFGLVQ